MTTVLLSQVTQLLHQQATRKTVTVFAVSTGVCKGAQKGYLLIIIQLRGYPHSRSRHPLPTYLALDPRPIPARLRSPWNGASTHPT